MKKFIGLLLAVAFSASVSAQINAQTLVQPLQGGTGNNISSATTGAPLAWDGSKFATTVTPVVVTALTSSGVITEAPRTAAYQWTAWNPSDILGTVTNAPATAVATSTATNYITMVNASGTVTFTFSKAGNYLITATVTLNDQLGATTDAFHRWNIGGTATRLLSGTAFTQTVDSGRTGTQTQTFLVVATAAQTLTLLPSISVTQAAGNVANYIGQANTTATYVGQ